MRLVKLTDIGIFGIVLTDFDAQALLQLQLLLMSRKDTVNQLSDLVALLVNVYSTVTYLEGNPRYR